MYSKRWKKRECSQFRYLRELLFCDMGWVNHFTCYKPYLEWGGWRTWWWGSRQPRWPAERWRCPSSSSEEDWPRPGPEEGQGEEKNTGEVKRCEVWLLHSPLDAAPRSTSAAALWHSTQQRGSAELMGGRGGGGWINKEKVKRLNLGSRVIIVKNLSAHCICLFVCLLWQPACIFCLFNWVADNECFLSQNTPCCLLSLFLYSCGETLESTLSRVINILLTRSHFLRSQHRSCRSFPRT